MRAVLFAAVLVWSSAARAAEVAVFIDNFTFSPAELTVAPGTTVVWTNRDDIPHTVTSADAPPRFASAALDTDDRVTFTFDQPGSYRYFCSLHPHMQGVVVVR